MADHWLDTLKAAYDAGYYQTEADVERQSGFPWQNTFCRDCPFHMNELCQVTLTHCVPDDIPCAYYDPPDHALAKQVIVDRLWLGWRRWKLLE